MKRLWVVVLLLLLSVSVSGIWAQDDIPSAEFVNDEGGVTVVTGDLMITQGNVKAATYQPIIYLEDQAGFVDRDVDFFPSSESQVVGEFIDNFFSPVGTPIAFQIALPIVPQGEWRDVDQNNREDEGVQVFAPALNYLNFGDVAITRNDRRGTGGWTTEYVSTRITTNPEMLYEVIGGTLLVYVGEDEQGFPSGFGDDGLLFTEDDPIVMLPSGYTMVDLNHNPFLFDRSSTVVMDTHEPEDLIPDDYSGMTYANAFQSLIKKAENEYAFTEYKDMDWQALEDEFMPRFEQADEDEDADAYLFALRDFAASIPDGHISFGSNSNNVLQLDEFEHTVGGLGMSLLELDDGRIITTFILDGSPADDEGIELGAEVIAIDDVPIQEAIENTQPYSAPFSLESVERLEQLRYVIRFPVDIEVSVTYQNPDTTRERTATMTTVQETESFNEASPFGNREATAPPVSYRFLDNGYGYVQVNSFAGNEPLMVETWEYFMYLVNATQAPGVIVDLRTNGGGFSFIGRRMAGYFFNEEINAGYDDTYNSEIDEFFYDPQRPNLILPPENPFLIYNGPVTVLIGPGCASACEFFAYYLSLENRSTFVGEHGTMGLGGGYYLTYLPEGVAFALPTNRPLDADGNIIIEGQGIQPDVEVPIDEETAFSTSDVVLDAAVVYLDEENAPDYTVTDGGTVELGDEVTGEIEEGERIQYTLELEEGEAFSIFLEGEDEGMDTVLRIYDTNGNLILENDDAASDSLSSAIENRVPNLDITLIVEVATFNDAESGTYILRTVQEN
jgi:C-terminal processing protease CtpA/Prc